MENVLIYCVIPSEFHNNNNFFKPSFNVIIVFKAQNFNTIIILNKLPKCLPLNHNDLFRSVKNRK